MIFSPDLTPNLIPSRDLVLNRWIFYLNIIFLKINETPIAREGETSYTSLANHVPIGLVIQFGNTINVFYLYIDKIF